MHANILLSISRHKRNPDFSKHAVGYSSHALTRPVNKGTQTKGGRNSNAGDWEDPGRKTQTGQVPGKKCRTGSNWENTPRGLGGAVYIEAPLPKVEMESGGGFEICRWKKTWHTMYLYLYMPKELQYCALRVKNSSGKKSPINAKRYFWVFLYSPYIQPGKEPRILIGHLKPGGGGGRGAGTVPWAR